LDARDCALYRVSFGLNAGGAGAGARGNMRAPALLARAGAAGRAAISTDLASRPCGSSLSLAPVAQVSRSLLWINPRPCGSTLAGVGQCPTATGHGCPAGLRAGVPDRRSVSPLSSSLGAVGRARAGAAVRRSPSAPFFGGPATVGAGPLMCADGWDVTVWRTVSAAWLRQSRGHRTERGQPVSHQLGTTAVALSAKLAFGACQPARCPGAGGDRAGRHRARQSQLLPTALIGQRLDHARHFTRPVARSPPADPRRLGCGPGQPDLAATTTRGHDTPRPDP